MDLPYYDASANALFGAIVYMVTYATVSFKADEEKFRQSAERSPEWTHWAVGAGVLIVIGLAAVVGAYVEVAPYGAGLGFLAGMIKGLYERGKAGVT